ncbi:hypothetical protein ASG43_19465 [Aureimonas sp. Leaf454]|uniref:ABC transporter permease n=1 Tax=Aureimonas sp. Leaf454 TaxID=1736381 RepID=UPI0006F679DA|nr:ABC transporter permease [Aureimonas sp. Leaf454]KQT53157.1 hypothetical protein ASG43_19465 [Aureimonas sp. Leaf454]
MTPAPKTLPAVAVARRRERARERLAALRSSREALLVVLFLAIFVALSLAVPAFPDIRAIPDDPFHIAEKAIVALALAFVILCGEIDMSVAGIVALASGAIGGLAATGAGFPETVLAGLGVGLLCGLLNGTLVSVLRLPSVLATLATMCLFRGIAYALPGGGVGPSDPGGLALHGPGGERDRFVLEIAAFLGLALLAAIVLHRTSLGKSVRAIGLDPAAARAAGLRVERITFAAFLATGLAAGLAAVLLTSPLDGAARPSSTLGWELDIVTLVLLGGISITGGSGSILGVVLAALLMGLVQVGLGLFAIPGIIMSVCIGLLVIFALAAPQVSSRLASRRAAGMRP